MSPETGEKWTNKTNQLIVEKMIKNKILLQRVKNALEHSPEKIDNVSQFVKQIENTPEIKAILRGPGGMKR